MHPYKPPQHLGHLAKTAARTQVGWGVHDDGSVGVEHIMSSNPFAGKAKVWGIANINSDGDIQLVSNGPSDSHLSDALPQELVDKVVKFYEREGLNVRNVGEHNPSAEKTALIEHGEKACPHCGEQSGLYITPGTDFADCENCGWQGPQDDLIEFGQDPDPDRNYDPQEPYELGNRGLETDLDDWAGHMSNEEKTAASGVSLQGAPVGSPGVVEGVAVRPDIQSREEIEAQVGGLEPAPNYENEQQFVDKVNEGQGTSFPRSDNPYINRGGSYLAEDIEDHFLGGKEAAPAAGIPGTGIGDTRNFTPQNIPGYVVVGQHLTPKDNWLFGPKCKGIVAEFGGVTSHGAQVAMAMKIPAIVDASGVGAAVQPGDSVRLDTHAGRVDVNGGDPAFTPTEKKHARRELVRFVWSKGNHDAAPVVAGDHTDRQHQEMIEDMLGEDTYDFEDGTIGVIYNDGTAEYYEPISDPDALENWLRSTYPKLVQSVVEKQTAGGIYQPVAAAEADNEADKGLDKAPECPECGSHTYSVIAYPDGTIGDGLLECLNCGANYKHHLYMNPKGGSIEKLAPGKEHMKGVSPKRNRQYEHILESCHKEHPDWSEERCKELAARTVNKQRAEKGETKDSATEDCGCDGVAKEAADRERCDKCGHMNWEHNPSCELCDCDYFEPEPEEHRSKLNIVEAADGKFGPGTRVQVDHPNLRGKGTILELGGKNEHLGEEHYTIQLDNGDKVEEIPESAFKKIKSAGADEVQVNDTNGHPLTLNQLYMMHSTEYKLPDLVRIVNITPQQIEAHIDSDEHGMFPINIDPQEYTNLGYSFTPYVETEEDKLAKVAARKPHLTPKRQDELINENMGARARNFDKLNLDGTHYVTTYQLIPSSSDDPITDHFLW